MPRRSYAHYIKHFTRPLADAPELVWEGLAFKEGQNDTEAWLEVYATDNVPLRMWRWGYDPD